MASARPPPLYVHLDFKGLPLSPDTLCGHIELLKRFGITGLVLEWEDMLPYSGSMACLSAPNAYTEYEVKNILAAAEGLELIPLVQTLGHCENLLKHDAFAMLREDPEDYGTMCPCHPDTPMHLRELMRQVIELHPGVTRIHIGCDEPTLGASAHTAAAAATDPAGLSGVLIDHVARTATAAHELGCREVLMWHDAAATLDDESLRTRLLPTGVSIVVWDYAPELTQASFVTRLASLGASPYVATSWKGADGADAIVPTAAARIANQRAWINFEATCNAAPPVAHLEPPSPSGLTGGDALEELEGQEEEESKRTFCGVVLTGWSRYGHLQPLTEMLPAGFPSLMTAIALWQAGVAPDSQPRATSGVDAATAATIDAWELEWRGTPACFPDLCDLCRELDNARATLSSLEEERRHSHSPDVKLRMSPQFERRVLNGTEAVRARLRDIEAKCRTAARGYSMNSMLQLAFTGDAEAWVAAKVVASLDRAKVLHAAATDDAERKRR